MKLNHRQSNLWLESNILQTLTDADGNPKTLKNILDEVKDYAIKRTIEKTGCKKKDAKKEEEYKNTLGWLGEVLCEFWLLKFGHRHDLTSITDTSDNPFQRGFDFSSSVIIGPELGAIIQVKMQSEDRAFTFKSLYTFLDEARNKGTQPRYTVLMIPTAEGTKEEMLSWKDDFKKRYSSSILFIGQRAMNKGIMSLSSPIAGNNANLEFFIQFRECLNRSCSHPVSAI